MLPRHAILKDPEITPMATVANEGNGCYRFQASPAHRKERLLRLCHPHSPHHPDAVTPFLLHLVTWASNSVATPDLALK